MATFGGVALILVAALLLYVAIQVGSAPSPSTGSDPVAGDGTLPLVAPSAPGQQAQAASAPAGTWAQPGLDPAEPGSPALVPPGSPAPTPGPAAPGKTTPARAVAPVHAGPPPPRPLPHSGPVTQSVIWNVLRVAGFSQVQTAGLMGNMQNESAFNPELNWPDVNGYHAYGLISWNAAFYPNAPSLVTGKPWPDLTQQVGYLLHHTKRVGKGLRGSTAAEVASNWSDYVEACASCGFGGDQNIRRQAIAGFIYQEAIAGRWG